MNHTVKHPGKTRRDHESGAWHRRKENNELRADWCNDPKRHNAVGSFPYNICNGKRNRALKDHFCK